MSSRHAGFFLDRRIPPSVTADIQQHGGLIAAELAPGVCHLMPFPPHFHVLGSVRHSVYSDSFVSDCVLFRRKLDLSAYELKRDKCAKPHRRNAYSYEDECRIHAYVKAHDNGRMASLSYWEEAKEVLGAKHSAESLKFHYWKYTSKMKFGDGKNGAGRLEKTCEKVENEEKSPVIVSVWPQGVVFEPTDTLLKRPNISQSPPRKWRKGADESPLASVSPNRSAIPTTPISERPSVLENTPASSLSSTFSQLSVSPCDILVTNANGKREVTVSGTRRVPNAQILQKFGRLASFCREAGMTQVSDREVMRLLLHFSGDIQSVLSLYFPSAS